MIGGFTALVPEILLVLSMIGLLMRGVFSHQKKTQKTQRSPKIWLAFGVLGVLIFFTFFYFLWNTPRFHGDHFNGFLRTDLLALFGKMMVLGFGLPWTGIRWPFIRSALHKNGFTTFEYPVLFLTSLLGGCLLISSHDMMAAYLGLELQMLPLFVAIGLRRDVQKSLEASFKYFVLSILASIIILYGIGLVYGYGASTQFHVLEALLDHTAQGSMSESWLQMGGLFVIAGFLFKMHSVPFHIWAPDVYEGSSNAQVPFLATVPKITAVIFLVRLLRGPFDGLLLSQGLSWLAVFSVLGGSFLAFRQENLRRLMAYASIAQIGYVLLGVSLGTVEGMTAALGYMVVYFLGFSGVFIGLNGMGSKEGEINTVGDLKGLWKKSKSQTLLLTVMILSLAGLPPFGGFWTKFHVLLSAVDQGLALQVLLVLLGALISLYYYLRLLRAFFFDASNGKEESVGPHGRALMTIIALFLGLFLLIQGPFFTWIQGIF